MKLEYGAYSHRGNVRKCNEDYYFIPGGDNTPQGLIMVADGMGGHNAGDLASRMVVEAILEFYHNEIIPTFSLERAREYIEQSIQQANLRVYLHSKTNQAYEGMGTTLTLVYFCGGHACVGHVGDSRGYLVRDGKISQITRDHSLVQELLDNGSITREEVDHHPQKNVITRALGTGESVDIDYYEISLEDNDIIILCTDGLTHHVDLKENTELFALGHPMVEIATVLGQKALQGGGTDNVTIVAAKYIGTVEER